MNSKVFQLAVIGLVLIHCFTLESLAQMGLRPLNKQEAVALALNQNFGIQLAQKRSELASVNTGWGAAGALPQIGISTAASNTVSDQRENPTSFIQERLESESLNASAQLNWVLFDGMRMFANKQALDVLAEQAEGQVTLVVEQTVVAVLMAYDGVLIEMAVEDVLRNSLAVSAERLSRLESAQEWGGAMVFDRLQIQNALFADSLALVQQGLSREVAMHNFSRLLGGSEWSDWKLTSTLDQPVENGGWDSIKSSVLRDATTIRNAMLSRELADVGIAQAESGLFPVVQLSSSFVDQRSTFAAGDLSGEGRSKNLAANLSLNFNIFNGGSTRRAIQQAKIQMEVANLDFADQQREVLLLARTAMDRMTAQASVHKLALRMAQNATELLEMGRDRLEFGAINSLDFRELQVVLQRAEMEVLRTQQAWSAAQLDLKRLQGFWNGTIELE
ncbi:MAG: TolC family protein [Flavobacteriales bacterium]|nr:TolC family protein [Flavobacteriales bacterium]